MITAVTIIVIIALGFGFIWAMSYLSNQMDYSLEPPRFNNEFPVKEFIESAKVETKPVEKRKCKPYDTRPFTQAEYDIIISKFNDFKEFNKLSTDKLTQYHMSLYFNGLLDLDKSVTSYRRIWSGKVNREDLPTAR